MSDTTHKRRTGRQWRWALVALLGIGLAAAPAASALRGPKVPAARVARRAVVQAIVANGRVLSPAQVHLGTLIAGVVAEVRAEEGQHVNAGDLLLRLQDDEQKAALNQAGAAVAREAARLDQVAVFSAPLAGEALRTAEVDLRKAQLDYDRARALFESGAVAQSQLDDAENALQRAKATRLSRMLEAQSSSSSGSEGRVNRATLLQARASVAAAEARLAQARIVAPADGVILTRAVEPGDIVQPGKVLLVLARDGETRLLIQPDERNLASLRVGQRARAAAEAFPDQPFDAEVMFIAPSVDPTRGTVDVKLRVPSPPPFLRADMTVSVNITAGERANALVIPPEAARDATGAEPWALVLRGDRTERVPIRIGLRDERSIEVTEGLNEGEVVVLPSKGEGDPGRRVRPEIKE